MYQWAKLHIKNVKDIELFRCIHKRFLFPEDLRRSSTNRLLRYGLTESGSAQFVDATKKYLLNLTQDQLIAFHAGFPFRGVPGISGAPLRYPAGRFNDLSFPALYAAEDEDTSIEEVWYRLRTVGSVQFEYAVFSISLTSRVADLRPAITSGIWAFPEEHAPCQVVGKYVHDTGGIGGILSFSKRRTGGTCCAIFFEKDVSVGSIVDVNVKRVN